MNRNPTERRGQGTTASLPRLNSDSVGSTYSATLLSMAARVDNNWKTAPCTALHFPNSTSIDKPTSILAAAKSYPGFATGSKLTSPRPYRYNCFPHIYLRSRYQRPPALCKRIYRNSEVGTCSSIDSIRDVIRRSTSASPCARFFSASNN